MIRCQICVRSPSDTLEFTRTRTATSAASCRSPSGIHRDPVAEKPSSPTSVPPDPRCCGINPFTVHPTTTQKPKGPTQKPRPARTVSHLHQDRKSRYLPNDSEIPTNATGNLDRAISRSTALHGQPPPRCSRATGKRRQIHHRPSALPSRRARFSAISVRSRGNCRPGWEASSLSISTGAADDPLVDTVIAGRAAARIVGLGGNRLIPLSASSPSTALALPKRPALPPRHRPRRHPSSRAHHVAHPPPLPVLGQ